MWELIKILPLWLFVLASANGDSRSARQWIFPAPPDQYIVPYRDIQGPQPYPYNTAEADMQLSHLYNQIMSYNDPPLLPRNEVSEVISTKYVLKNPTYNTFELSSKLKEAEYLFDMFGSKLGITRDDHKVKDQTTTVNNLDSNLNTVKVLPEHLRKFFDKLKEESRRRENIAYVPIHQLQRRQESISTSIKNHMNIDKYIINSDDDLIPSEQHMRSDDISLEEDQSNEEDRMSEGIRTLTNEEIRELIIFFHKIMEMYQQIRTSTDSVILYVQEHVKSVTESDDEGLSTEIDDNKPMVSTMIPLSNIDFITNKKYIIQSDMNTVAKTVTVANTETTIDQVYQIINKPSSHTRTSSTDATKSSTEVENFTHEMTIEETKVYEGVHSTTARNNIEQRNNNNDSSNKAQTYAEQRVTESLTETANYMEAVTEGAGDSNNDTVSDQMESMTTISSYEYQSISVEEMSTIDSLQELQVLNSEIMNDETEHEVRNIDLLTKVTASPEENDLVSSTITYNYLEENDNYVYNNGTVKSYNTKSDQEIDSDLHQKDQNKSINLQHRSEGENSLNNTYSNTTITSVQVDRDHSKKCTTENEKNDCYTNITSEDFTEQNNPSSSPIDGESNERLLGPSNNADTVVSRIYELSNLMN